MLDCLTAEHFGVPGASKLVSQGSDLDLEHWDECVKGLPAKERRWIEQAETDQPRTGVFPLGRGFPGRVLHQSPTGGMRRFDAVVGNPP